MSAPRVCAASRHLIAHAHAGARERPACTHCTMSALLVLSTVSTSLDQRAMASAQPARLRASSRLETSAAEETNSSRSTMLCLK
jgi:hypothetical protein